MFFDLIKNFPLQILIISILSYLIGSISFPIIVTKFFKKNQDIRDLGSGNAGFTNVLRSVGVLPAVITFIGDFFKCFAAISLSRLIFSYFSCDAIPKDFILLYVSYISGFLCIIGHIYPCFFKFRGGKSIIASFSMMMATHWQVGLIILGIFLIVLLLFKIISLASITCATLYPTVNIVSMKLLIFNQVNDYFSFHYIIFTTIISILVMAIVVYKHSPNIKRLLNGTEKKITTKK